LLNNNLKNQNDRFVTRKNNLAIFLGCCFFLSMFSSVLG
jgi:hypothetical protein